MKRSRRFSRSVKRNAKRVAKITVRERYLVWNKALVKIKRHRLLLIDEVRR
jgi:hypothetical protein